MRRTVVLAIAVASLLAGLAVAPARAATPAPERIRALRTATRAIVVTSGAWRGTYAVMRLYQRTGGRWRLVRGPMPARVGQVRLQAGWLWRATSSA